MSRVEFSIPNEPRLWVTKSRMQSFRYCQRQYYYFAYMQFPFLGSPAMLKGRRFHYHSSKFYRLLGIDLEPDYDYYRGLLPTVKDEEENVLYDNFAKFELTRMQIVLEDKLDPELFFLPAINEQWIRLEEEKLSAHVDRVFLLNEPKGVFAAVFEIKTGKISNKTSLRREGCFYTYILNQTKWKDVIGAPLDYVGAYSPKENDFWTGKISKRTWTAMYGTLDRIIYAQLTRKVESDWPKNETVNCTFCSYVGICWRDEPLKEFHYEPKEDTKDGKWSKTKGKS